MRKIDKNDPYEKYLFSDRPPWKPTTLKQKALWVSALVFWLIAACTLFAVKNQELMTPQVTTVSAETSYSSGSPAKLPLDCLQLDSEGGMHLYEIYEGTGWEAGVRVREVQGFSLDEENVFLDNGGWGEYVQYASKTLTDGELVEVIRGGDKAADQWLAVFPEDAPEPDHLPSGVEIVAQDGNALLLSVESDQQPFMEGWAKSLVPELSGARVYSLSAMEQFQGNFICTGLLLMIFVIVFWMWGYAWYENQLPKKYPRMWPMSVGVSIVLLGGIAVILHFVSLPSSLLPPEQITDLWFYGHDFGQAFPALERFGAQFERGNRLVIMQTAALFCSLVFMAVGAGIGYLIARVEEFYMEEICVKRMRRGEWR